MRPHSSPRPTRQPSPRNGFTLVEALVAIVLIEIGLLALTASSGIVIRETTLVRARVAALEAARNRLESLSATTCVATSGSAGTTSSVREVWSARLAPVGRRDITDTATYAVQRVVRTLVLSTTTPCAP